SAWTGVPYLKSPSLKAYELTLAVMGKKMEPGKRRPFLKGIEKLAAARTSFTDDPAGEKWLKDVGDWFKQDQVTSALKGLALAPSADRTNREQALSVLESLGAPTATLQRI